MEQGEVAMIVPPVTRGGMPSHSWAEHAHEWGGNDWEWGARMRIEINVRGRKE